MTKAEIVDSVYDKVGGFSKKEAAEVVEVVFDTMKEVLASGHKIKISGFGNFVVRDKKQRVGRNPQTGAPIPISARRVLTFKPSQVLKGILNPEKQDGASDAAPGYEGPLDGRPARTPRSFEPAIFDEREPEVSRAAADASRDDL